VSEQLIHFGDLLKIFVEKSGRNRLTISKEIGSGGTHFSMHCREIDKNISMNSMKRYIDYFKIREEDLLIVKDSVNKKRCLSILRNECEVKYKKDPVISFSHRISDFRIFIGHLRNESMNMPEDTELRNSLKNTLLEKIDSCTVVLADIEYLSKLIK